ncbi:MAG: acyl--CoA ligase [Oscillospiraceae bacterium]|nr:acyl--CoA ligase [Oscillospiraceae bacterium]
MSYTYDAAGFKEIFEKSFIWISGFMRNVFRSPEKPALIDPIAEKSYSYRELNADANRLADALSERGMKYGDMVMYQLYNSYAFALCYIAPQKLGGINSPVNFNISAGETARLLERDRPFAYVYDIEVAAMAGKALELSSYKPTVVLASDFRGKRPALPEGHIFLEEFLSEGNPGDKDFGFTPNMYAEVTRFCTSGTTGTPKGVPLNNANEVLSAHDTIMHFGLSAKDVTMNMTPWFHRGGLHCGGPNGTLYVGGTVVVMRMFSAKVTFDCIKKYGISYLIGVPSALKALSDRQEKHPEDLSRLKGIVTMGSPLEKEDCMRYQRLLTPNILNGYGTTETFVNTYLRPYDLPEMSGFAGSACIDDDVRVVAIYEDRKAAPTDTVPRDSRSEGEVIIYSPFKSGLCYADNPEMTLDKYKDGWYYTKDIGVWDENGYVRILGRRDDMIISMGENIYPEQLEEVIKQHPKVSDCMVVGVPDPSRGQTPAAFIIRKDDSLTVKEINSFLYDSDNLPSYMCPRFYSFVSSLPYTLTGKKQHHILRADAARALEAGELLRP